MMNNISLETYFNILEEIKNNFKIMKIKYGEFLEYENQANGLSKDQFKKLYDNVYAKYQEFHNYISTMIAKHNTLYDEIYRLQSSILVEAKSDDRYNEYSKSIYNLSKDIELIQRQSKSMFCDPDMSIWFDIGLLDDNLWSDIEDLITYKFGIGLYYQYH